MKVELFYTIALPFIIAGSVASISNRSIQAKWFKHYMELHRKTMKDSNNSNNITKKENNYES